jgi:hypothetical protein
VGQFGNSFAEGRMSIGVLSLGVPWTAQLHGSSMGYVQLHHALASPWALEQHRDHAGDLLDSAR